MDFDMALRLFMDAFRPPGEGQKIDRIMQVGGGVFGGVRVRIMQVGRWGGVLGGWGTGWWVCVGDFEGGVGGGEWLAGWLP